MSPIRHVYKFLRKKWPNSATHLILLFTLVFDWMHVSYCAWCTLHTNIAGKTVSVVSIIITMLQCFSTFNSQVVACALKHQQQLSLSLKYTTQVHNCIVSWQLTTHKDGLKNKTDSNQSTRTCTSIYNVHKLIKGEKVQQFVELA